MMRLGTFAAAAAGAAMLALAACGQPRDWWGDEESLPIGQAYIIDDAYENARQPEAADGEGSDIMASASAHAAQDGRALRVGVLLPLSGRLAAIGQAFRNAMLLASADMDTSSLTLQFYDTAGDASAARAAAATAMRERAELLVGPLLAEETRAVSRETDGAVPVVAFTSDALALGGRTTTLAWLIPEQVERVVAHACANGARRLAVMGRDGAIGRVALKAARHAMAACGGTVTVAKLYADAGPSLMPAVREALGRRAAVMDRNKQLAKEKKAASGNPAAVPLPFDAVLMADEGSGLRALASALAYYDLDAAKFKILSTQAVAGLADPVLSGVLYAGAAGDGAAKFALKYQEAFGAAPPPLAAQAYDAVALAAAVADGRAGLYDAGGFAGVEGSFRFTRAGFPQRLAAILRVQAGKPPRVAEPAPESFDAAEPDYTYLYDSAADIPEQLR
ncbi:penicillin-binding protein activator [Alphaproteobacteria bacterium]|nr:penicillin-binding protein activator [Alphaproteobacteria bacterium]